MDNVPKETHALSAMTHWLASCGGGKCQRPTGRSSSPAPNSKGQDQVANKKEHVPSDMLRPSKSQRKVVRKDEFLY